ncbi:hypothetical protein ACFTWF_39585 [Rhodococcus sp. NPDC056960]
MRESLTLQRRLHRELPHLKRRYAAVAPTPASQESWEEFFGRQDT